MIKLSRIVDSGERRVFQLTLHTVPNFTLSAPSSSLTMFNLGFVCFANYNFCFYIKQNVKAGFVINILCIKGFLYINVSFDVSRAVQKSNIICSSPTGVLRV